PVSGLEMDQRTLAMIDLNEDGRIRVPEILEAIRWAARRLKDPAFLLRGIETLPLDAINPDTPEGQRTLASARMILNGLGKPEAKGVTLGDAMDQVHLF